MKTENLPLERLSTPEREYWLKELVQPLPVIGIPTDFSQNDKETLGKLNKTISLEEDLRKYLKGFHCELDTHSFMLAAYFVLITRLSNEKDILVGANIDNTIYPIRISLEGIKTFKELLLLVKKKLENCSNYSFVSEEIVSDELLFQTTFTMNIDKMLINEAMLNWQIEDRETDMLINIQYDGDLFKTSTIERFIKYYINVLKHVIISQNTSIYGFNILTEEEMEIYSKLNDTYTPFPKDKTIFQMFENAAHNFPHNIAISSDKGQFTYKELNERANQLANGLIEKGLKKGDFVTIFMERSLETIISIMGILKAGGVYVPVDPEHPEDRNAYIISDTKSPFIVTKNLYIGKAKELLSNSESVKEIIIIENDIHNFSTENPHIHVNPEDLAYVIYTSGSTGRPKGTIVAHQGVVNLGCLIRNHFDVNEKEVLTQFATYSFDASVWDTFAPLFWGARLHLLSPEERISVEAFADVIDKIKATFIISIPTVFFNQITTYLSEESYSKLSSVKRIGIGGEALSGEMLRAFQRKFHNSIEVSNLYGPTETTVVATGYKVSDLVPEDQVNIPIGKPFDNYEVYIVNEENQLCPINVPGEMYISSIALAKGYLNQEEKTKKVFIENPFKPNSMVYKSGDIARILENGLIEYVSRKDSQVKVRGHRIEIGEIEDAFAKHPEVQDVAIVAKKDNNEVFLVGYYTSRNGKKIKTSEIKSFLLDKLPFYMVPKYINHLKEMPVSPTGKVDRKKLATFEIFEVEENDTYVAPRNEIEKVIADAWKEVLGLEQVSIYDDFFEIGGHSLKIMSVLVLLKPHFPGLRISDFFIHKTVADLAALVKELQKQGKTSNKNNEYNISEIKDLMEYPSCLHSNIDLDIYGKPKNILLTGSTGYLGSHILYELLKNTNAKIYCLIRKSNNKSLLEKLLDTMRVYFGEEITEDIKERVITIEGDLGKDKLGLSLADEVLLKEMVDTIIHAAADVRHFGDASHFEKVNIQGTKYLLDIAKCRSSIRFHYVSSLGIVEDLALSGKWEEIISKEKFDNDLKLESVYTNSKLESEKLVYQAGEEGTAVTIYRGGNLTCRSDNGQFQKNINTNAFYRMIKSMLLLGKAPKADCYLDFTAIDYASKAIVYLACLDNTIGETFHICNPNQISYSSVINMINNYGYKVELLDQAEYEKWLFDRNINKNQEGLELAIAQLDGDGVKDSHYRFACPNTMKYLDSSYLKYAETNQDFIDKMLNYAIKIGYFPKP